MQSIFGLASCLVTGELVYEVCFLILLFTFTPLLPGCAHRAQKTFNIPPPLSLAPSLTGSKSQSQSHSGLPGVMGRDLQCSLFATSQPQRITESSFFCCHRDEKQILLVHTIAPLGINAFDLKQSCSFRQLTSIPHSKNIKTVSKVDGFLNE